MFVLVFILLTWHALNVYSSCMSSASSTDFFRIRYFVDIMCKFADKNVQIIAKKAQKS